jgi:hypothetical protein
MTAAAPLTGAAKIGDLAIKLADAALVARERGDDVHAIFFAIKAAETFHLAKLLGWTPLPSPDREGGE